MKKFKLKVNNGFGNGEKPPGSWSSQGAILTPNCPLTGGNFTKSNGLTVTPTFRPMRLKIEQKTEKTAIQREISPYVEKPPTSYSSCSSSIVRGIGIENRIEVGVFYTTLQKWQ